MAANDEKLETETEDTQTEEASEQEPSTKKKKKKKRAADDGGGSKDRNKRVREQAARKMEEARERAKSRAGRIGATGLDAGEMMDDAMARGFAAFMRWLKNNRRSIEFSIAGLILAGAGYGGWDWYSHQDPPRSLDPADERYGQRLGGRRDRGRQAGKPRRR